MLEYSKQNNDINYSWLNEFTMDDLHNGLSKEDNLRLFATPFVDEVIHLITKGIKSLRNNNQNLHVHNEDQPAN